MENDQKSTSLDPKCPLRSLQSEKYWFKPKLLVWSTTILKILVRTQKTCLDHFNLYNTSTVPKGPMMSMQSDNTGVPNRYCNSRLNHSNPKNTVSDSKSLFRSIQAEKY